MSLKLKICLFIIGLLSLYQFLYYALSSHFNKPEQFCVTACGNKFESIEKNFLFQFSQRNRGLLVKLQSHLAAANRYARSGNTINEINQAFTLLNKIIQKADHDHHQSKTDLSNSSHSSAANDHLVDVCPETRLDHMTDYPLYNTQMKIVNCSNSRPFHQMVGFAILTSNCSTARSIIQGINKYYGHVRVTMGIQSSDSCDLAETHSTSFQLLHIRLGVANDGVTWKSLIQKLSTNYVLIGRDLYTFTNQSNIERLVRVISETNVDAVGGPQRFDDGRWFTGCYQMSMKNYTLKLLEGYDLSHKSCMYCDYLSTAFLARRDSLMNKLHDEFTGNALFVDFFIQLFDADRVGALSCVDVMFSSDYQDINDQSRDLWRQVAIKWKLNRIVLPNSKDVWFDCEESKVFCPKRKGEVVPPCCLKELSDAFLTMMSICRDLNSNCTMISGGMIGAIKFYGVIPWERDADIEFHAQKYIEFGERLRQRGYSLSVKYYKNNLNECLKKNMDCMYYGLHTTNWNIEMYGGGWIVSDIRGDFREPTKVLFHGVWVNTYMNPGLSSRVLYGDDVLKHVEHWRDLGYKTGWTNYSETESGKYMQCSTKRFHGCLTNYLTTGNIQFKDIWI